MYGRVVLMGAREHECAPGWTYEADENCGARYAIPPHAGRYPKGTVWECACSRTWVSLGETPRGGLAGPGVMGWRPETRRQRRRRVRTS